MPKLLLLLSLNLLPSEFKQELAGRFHWLQSFSASSLPSLAPKASLFNSSNHDVSSFFRSTLFMNSRWNAGGCCQTSFCIFWNGCVYVYQELNLSPGLMFHLRLWIGQQANSFHQLRNTERVTEKCKIAWLPWWTTTFFLREGRGEEGFC